ncbi:hypothetical protein AAY473_016466 [Plecturocebus cupreus]
MSHHALPLMLILSLSHISSIIPTQVHTQSQFSDSPSLAPIALSSSWNCAPDLGTEHQKVHLRKLSVPDNSTWSQITNFAAKVTKHLHKGCGSVNSKMLQNHLEGWLKTDCQPPPAEC